MEKSIRINLKVVPGASSQGCEWLGDDKSLLKIRVTAAPEKGKANKAVVKYLAAVLDLPGTAVTICSGSTSQLKTVELTGITSEQVRKKIAQT